MTGLMVKGKKGVNYTGGHVEPRYAVRVLPTVNDDWNLPSQNLVSSAVFLTPESPIMSPFYISPKFLSSVSKVYYIYVYVYVSV